MYLFFDWLSTQHIPFGEYNIISDISKLAIKTPEWSFYLWTDITLVLEDQNNGWGATYLKLVFAIFY